MPRLTIVVPCYNEAGRLDVEAFSAYRGDGHDVRFLFVDDGSTDDTKKLLATLHERDPDRFAVHTLLRNSGKGEAVRQGIGQALDGDADFVGFWDADLATPLAAIVELCTILEENSGIQLVMGSRVRLLGRDIRRHAIRHYLGRVFATIVSIMLRLSVYDTQCGAKLFRKSDVVRALFSEPFVSRWVFDVELIARLVGDRRETAGELICEHPLQEWHDIARSKLTGGDFVRTIGEIARIYWRYLR